jgi:hypothetical protein
LNQTEKGFELIFVNVAVSDRRDSGVLDTILFQWDDVAAALGAIDSVA